MGNVIDLEERRRRNEPHRTGPVRCLNCKHEWIATAPIGTVALECLQCHTFQGVFNALTQTEHDQWQCACGEWGFFIDTQGPYCMHCGIRPRFR